METEMRVPTCGDCIHVDVCARVPYFTEFSRDNPAYCKDFKDKLYSGWIPVTERLPEEECRCLVIDAAGDIEMDCYDGKGRFVLDRSGAVQHPSHWMPLPDAPEEV